MTRTGADRRWASGGGSRSGRGGGAGAGPRAVGPTGAGPGGTAALVVVAAAAAATGWVWVTGEAAGMIHSGTWLPVAPTAAVTVLRRLPGSWPRIGDAWPPALRRDLPGAVVLAAVAAVVAAVMVGAVAGVAHLWRRTSIRPLPGSSRPAGVDSGARWAGRHDLRTVAVRAGGGGRLVLGRAGRQLVATEARHSLLVVGPTQSGKTTGLAIPAILEWEGPVVATSVKDDLVAGTLGWREASGPTWVFDPTASAGASASAGWSPLAAAGTWTEAQRMASWLVEAAPARAGMTDGAFWFAAAAKLLAPLLLAAATDAGHPGARGHTGRATMASVVRWNDTGDFDEALDVLAAAGQLEACVALEACAGRDERLRSSVSTTLETVLGPFADPVVAAATAVTDVDVDGLVAGRGTLYLCGPSHEQFRVQGLFAGLVATVVAAAVDHVHRSGRPLDPPLLLVLDEAANIAPLRDLDTLASTAAGLGIQLVTVCQDLAQLATRYGQDRGRTIANNHRAKLILSGVSDLSTLDLVSGLAGEAAVRETSESADLRDGRRTRTTSVTYRRLAPTDALRRIPPGSGVLVYGHLPAARLSLRPWYADRDLAARAATTGPQ